VRERKTPDRRGDTKNRITASLKDGPQPKKKKKIKLSNLSLALPSCTFVSKVLSLSLSFFLSFATRKTRRKKTTTRRVHVRRAAARGEKKGSPFERISQNLSRRDRSAREKER
jgi:hypothetical protein